MQRRAFTALGALAGLGLVLPAAHAVAPAALQAHIAQRLRALEHASGGRLGVFIADTTSGAAFGQRADERFLMCSTFKLLASAKVLARVDRGEESLDRVIPFGKTDLVTYSPVTEQHADGAGMTLAALCEAALTTSDNTAANLILASYGGPPAVTAFARSLGDSVTRLDRIEPALNVWRDAVSDTTSPRAMAASLQRVTLGDALAPASRAALQRWLRANTTGTTRLKAGLPADWAIGDKTGAWNDARPHGQGVTTNDIAVVWPPGRAPLLVTAYLTRSRLSFEAASALLAQVGALLPEIVASLPADAANGRRP